MGSKYTTQAASGYNSSPPADDGSQVASNLVKWSTHKTKLADPIKTLADSINSALVTALDYSVRQITASDSVAASDHMKTVEIASTVTTAVTVTLGDAATLTNNFIVRIRNSTAINQTVGRATGGDTIDGSASNVTLPPGATVVYGTNTGANGFLTLARTGPFLDTNPVVTGSSDGTKKLRFEVDGLTTGNTRVMTVPDYDGTLATLAGTEELTNKTLNASVGKGTWTASGTWTLPAVTLGGAITYGGVTLSNAVTGTGNMVLSASPTLTGTAKIGDTGARTTGAFPTSLASSAGIEYDDGAAVFRGWGANAGTVAKARLRLAASDDSGTVYPWRADGSGNFYTGGSDGTTPSSTSAGIMAGVSNQLYTSVGNTSSSSIMHRFINANGLVGSITTSGSGTSFDTSSDKDLKIDDGIAQSTEVLEQTVIHNFRWKADNQQDIGVFAQDAYLVKPKAVRVGSDEVDENGRKVVPWAVDYSKYVPDLIVGWQKHEAKLKILLEEISAEHADLAALRAAVSARLSAL